MSKENTPGGKLNFIVGTDVHICAPRAGDGQVAAVNVQWGPEEDNGWLRSAPDLDLGGTALPWCLSTRAEEDLTFVFH